MNVKSISLGITGVLAATLIVASIHESAKHRERVNISNRMLASFDRTATHIDPSLYGAYVGLYRVDPDFNIEITTTGGQLFAQGTNQRRVEIYPADEQVFFNRHTEALITFDVPVKGKSQRFLLQQINRIRDGERISVDAS